MNKKELVSAVAEKTGMTQVAVKTAFDATLEVMADVLAKGDQVALIGFGSFQVVDRPQRNGVNPKTKEAIVIEARKAVKFKAGSELNEKIR